MPAAIAARRGAAAGLPALWTILVPAAVGALQVLARALDPGGALYFRHVESEQGLIENATALALLPAAGFAVAAARHLHRAARPRAAWWYAFAAAVAVAYCGEELSWGQHWVGWTAPGFFLEHNLHRETNIHNLSLQLGRVVKTIVTAAILFGAIVTAVRSRRGRGFDPGGPLREWLWPAPACLFTAVLVFGVRLLERLKTWFDLEYLPLMDMNLKELQEFYLAWFMLLYLWAAWERARRASPPAPSP